ncbi:Type 1 glutamine amidotransferase-like domain-containing protein [Embleya scabrispora]|uniref:Type 1 glutamine amidotransferase-like domain-containing protein n=1 Tax=Embleya scabrispora TaxID=159449 RepID=UPI00036DBEBC|nr:Type 1 glutamine amidotransferase-like domain-containing protein [Embleya scabrispora]MYS85587.1 type 1 glutamine amidotransferase-like domain-containing protein [Streptomyces sp. SID5474]
MLGRPALDHAAGAAIAVIANATDDRSSVERTAGVDLELAAPGALGLRPTELDLRAFFDRPRAEVAAALGEFPAVRLRGGNVFLLRHALARSGADGVLVELLRRDALVYAGYSAGACVLAPSLRGLEGCDDADALPALYGEPARWDGPAVLDHAFVPHIDSPGHPETQLLAAVAADYRTRGVPHRTLRDGQVLVIDGAHTTIR